MQYYNFYLPLSIRAHWRDWPPAARAVYPVLLSYVPPWAEQVLIHPSRQTIVSNAGRSLNTVGKGILWLVRHDHIQKKDFSTRRGFYVHGWTVPKELIATGPRMAMHTPFFRDGGPWGRLSPSAQSIYIAIRFISRAEIDQDFSGVDDFPNRTAETFKPLPKVALGRLAGYDRSSVSRALVELEKANVIFDDTKVALRWPQ
jgi:hypothetical protein